MLHIEQQDFIIEELDFPNKRKDMNLLNEKPTLKDILKLQLKDLLSHYHIVKL